MSRPDVRISALPAPQALHIATDRVTSARIGVPMGAPRLILAAYNPRVGAGRRAQSAPAAKKLRTINTLTVARGDTLMSLLVTAGSTLGDAHAAAAAIATVYDPRRLRAGQKITVAFERDLRSDGPPRLTAFSLALAKDTYAIVRRLGDRFVALEAVSPLAPEFGGSLVERTPRSTMRVRPGDTIRKLLLRAGSSGGDANAAIGALEKRYNLRQLQVGTEITVVLHPGEHDQGPRLAAVSLGLRDGSYLVAGRVGARGFRVHKAFEPLIPVYVAPPSESPAMTAEAPAAIPEAAPETVNEPFQETAETQRQEPAAPQVTTSQPAASQAATFAPTEAVRSEPPEFAHLPANAERRTLNIGKGDTLMAMLVSAGSSRRDAANAIEALGRRFNLRRLRIGRQVTVVFERGHDSTSRHSLAAVGLEVGDDSFVVAGRNEDGSFVSMPARGSLDAALDGAMFATLPPAEAIREVTFAPEPDGALRTRYKVRRGDTLMQALLRAGSAREDAHDAISALRRLYDPRRLQAGQLLTVTFDPRDAPDRPVLHGVSLRLEAGRNVESSRAEAGDFWARETEVPVRRMLVHAGGRIDVSLSRATRRAGVPTQIMVKMIRAFSFDVDFQRDIQRGDGFEVLFERFVDESGEVVREGNLLYAGMNLSGNALDVYRYAPDGGLSDYYDENGQSVRRALLRTPIEGGRLSSGYGRRKHPVLGYTRMHRGIDFSAPRGTPIHAAGDGVIERIGRNGAYGRYIRIRHGGLYSSAYAHLQGYAKGLRKGSRVKQAQVIGYLGSSGMVTGAHLHYEVMKNGKQINPLKIKLPQGDRLEGERLAAYQAARGEILRQIAALPLVQNVAQVQMAPLECDTAVQGPHRGTPPGC